MCHQSRPLIPVGMGSPLWGRIDSRLALDLCATYRGSAQDFEKVLEVESIIWPTLNKAAK